uniref:Peptidase S1 domain-containing protein n=1 Tax=Anopheles farauti TaxID=69004 RepID=A0A182QLP0_9DIPT
MVREVALLLAIVSFVSAATVPTIDWTRVRRVEELDHYWVRLPVEWEKAYREVVPSPRITNGQEAIPGQFPYKALVLSEIGMLTTQCGGSILTQNYILTAGHCVMFDQNNKVAGGTVIVGAHDRTVMEPTQQRVRFASTGIHVHPQYSASNLRFDVAVIRVGTSIRFTASVQPVRLPGRADQRQFDGFIGTVSGWGRTSDTEAIFPNTPHFTRNPILANAACISTWGSLLVEAQNVCLSGEGGRAACNGDSGGPLTVEEGSGRTLQIGITSFGASGGCMRGQPTVYARITYFLDWIVANSDYITSARTDSATTTTTTTSDGRTTDNADSVNVNANTGLGAS